MMAKNSDIIMGVRQKGAILGFAFVCHRQGAVAVWRPLYEQAKTIFSSLDKRVSSWKQLEWQPPAMYPPYRHGQQAFGKRWHIGHRLLIDLATFQGGLLFGQRWFQFRLYWYSRGLKCGAHA
jgi:hypothetical protein